MFRKRKRKKMLKCVGTILVTVLLVLILIPAGLRIFGFNSFYIMSGSMEPKIGTGSLVFVNSHDTDADAGDIIMYRLNNTNIVHRVIRILDNGELITKGDNNDTEDMEPVRNYQIYGTVMRMPWGGWCIPFAGYVSSWLQVNRVYLMILVAAAVIYGVFKVVMSEDE